MNAAFAVRVIPTSQQLPEFVRRLCIPMFISSTERSLGPVTVVSLSEQHAQLDRAVVVAAFVGTTVSGLSAFQIAPFFKHSAE